MSIASFRLGAIAAIVAFFASSSVAFSKSYANFILVEEQFRYMPVT